MIQIDRLQTEVQEKEMALSQKETMYRSEVADREEEISRLKADLSVLHDKLAQSEGQVVLSFFLSSVYFMLASQIYGYAYYKVLWKPSCFTWF